MRDNVVLSQKKQLQLESQTMILKNIIANILTPHLNLATLTKKFKRSDYCYANGSKTKL